MNVVIKHVKALKRHLTKHDCCSSDWEGGGGGQAVTEPKESPSVQKGNIWGAIS